jgi:glucose/arabinose dehydrogenase
LVKHLANEFGRLRAIVVGPDGFLYLTTSNRDGRGAPATDDDRIIKVNPSKL